uniref:Uncharacterized protein n=1 Tax=Tetranychus urticae TaxID=32264 RepID=T1KP03_TETUR
MRILIIPSLTGKQRKDYLYYYYYYLGEFCFPTNEHGCCSLMTSNIYLSLTINITHHRH